jgi:MFS transporter, DHA1 family, multidrug resistance protein
MVAVLVLSNFALGMQLPVLPLYLRWLGIAPTTIGLILATQGFALIVFEFGWGWWSDHVGVGLPLIITRSGIALVMFGYGIFQATPLFFLLQFATGAFQCASGPLPWSYFGHVIPVGRRGEAIALAQTANTIGLGIGALAGGLTAEALGYRPVFLVAACFAVASALLAILTFRDVGPVGERSAEEAAGPGPRPRAGPAYYAGPLAVIAVVTILTWIGASGERGFLPILAQARGLHPGEIGLLMTIVGTGAALLMVPIGRLSDRVGRKPVILAGIFLGAIGLAGYSLAAGAVALGVLAVLRAAANAATQPVAVALLSDVTPSRVRGRVMGLYGSLEDIGIAIGPALAGLVWSISGIGSAFLVMAAMNVGGLVVAAALLRERTWLQAREKTIARAPSA